MGKKIDYLILLMWVYMIIALPSFVMISLMNTVSPESDFFSALIEKTPSLSTVVITAFTLPAIGAVLSIFRKKIKAAYFWNFGKQEKIHTVTISLLLSIVLWQFFFILHFLNYLGLIILFLIFLFYLPLANTYLSSIDFNKLKRFITPYRKKSKIGVIEHILFAAVVLLLIHVSVIAVDGQIRAYNHHQIFLSRVPQIKSINPKIVYYANKVVLTGRGFGWGKDKDTKFMYQGGAIDITLWTDTKVIFTIPLHWKLGDITIWVQKPIEWDGKKTLVKSNAVKLRLISRDNGWDAEDDAYFEQLKHLDKETLEINGYQ